MNKILSLVALIGIISANAAAQGCIINQTQAPTPGSGTHGTAVAAKFTVLFTSDGITYTTINANDGSLVTFSAGTLQNAMNPTFGVGGVFTRQINWQINNAFAPPAASSSLIVTANIQNVPGHTPPLSPTSCQYTFQAIVLPVELAAFSARRADNAVVLNWLTKSETNNEFFTVERSTDGVKFETIGEVKGAGTTSEPQDYLFVDEKAAASATKGIVYYRLLQTDTDGTMEQAGHMVSVSMKSKNDLAVLAIRRDGAGSIMDFQSPAEQTVTLVISDINGRQVATRQIGAFEGLNQHNVEFGELPSGIYVATIRGGQALSTVKFAK